MHSDNISAGIEQIAGESFVALSTYSDLKNASGAYLFFLAMGVQFGHTTTPTRKDAHQMIGTINLPNPGNDADAGEQFAIEDYQLAMTESGHVVYYLGYLREDRLFSVSAAARSGVKPMEYKFVRVEQGCLLLDRLVNPTQYRIRDEYLVKLPMVSSNYFGVTHRTSGEEEPALTRAIFGATFAELNKLINVFAQLVDGPSPQWAKYPSITFSKQRDNTCDLTDAFIPQWFPYIAFTESSYFKGHVSLYGFYLQLAFLCDRSREIGLMPGNQFYHELLAAGVEAEVLDYILEASPVVQRPLRLGV